MVAPTVVALMVTDWPWCKVPAAGVNVGVAAVRVKEAEATGLGARFVPPAMALMVSVEEASKGPPYWLEAVVGVEPSVV